MILCYGNYGLAAYGMDSVHNREPERSRIYISVCAGRHKHINSSVSTPLNSTKIAVMKGKHWPTRMVGPEFLFSIYKC